MPMKIDMHCHTNISDGIHTPEVVISEAKRRGINALFITDHDHPSDIASIQRSWIITAPSVEISARNSLDANKSLHLTYYAREISEQVKGMLKNTRSQKESLIDLQLNHLIRLGFTIDKWVFYSELIEGGRQKAGISKYDIARFIASQKSNKTKLYELGCGNGKKVHQEFYNRCLKRRWELYNQYGIEIEEYEPDVLDLKEHASDAILSIAHPNVSFSKEGIKGFLEKFPLYQELGVNAVEINSRATKKWVEAILHLQKEQGDKLQLTFWSDCHRIGTPDDKHGDLGFENNFIPNEVIGREFDKFREKLGI